MTDPTPGLNPRRPNMAETDLADRECEAINEDVAIHFWPFSGPPAGTPCKCGETTRRSLRPEREM
jgi:hypothetical protein